MVHKTIHDAFTNHNKVLANTIDNVLKEVFFGAPVDQVAIILRLLEAVYLVLVSSRMVSNISSHQHNSFQEDKLMIKPCKRQGSKVKPYQR